MKEEDKRVVSRVLSLFTTLLSSFLLPNICSQCLLSCLLFVLGYGWKCLDFDTWGGAGGGLIKKGASGVILRRV